MLFRVILLLGLVFVSTGFVFAAGPIADEWTGLMFVEKEHDFGTVSKNAKIEYRFELKNPYEEEIHIANVSTSCTCSTPTIEVDTLRSYEKGAIHVRFNTENHNGPQKATISVHFDKPQVGTAVLQVRGVIQSDVTFLPGSVNFETVSLGEEKEKTITAVYSGPKSTWKIQSVESSNPLITTEIIKTRPQPGRIEVDLKVKLPKDFPAGPIREKLLLVTNMAVTNRIPVMIEGTVKPKISVNPETIYLGTVPPGQKIVKPVIVSGEKPFVIKGVEMSDKIVKIEAKFDPKSAEAIRFVVPLTFLPTEVDETDSVRETVKFITDDPNHSPVLPVYAVVKPAE